MVIFILNKSFKPCIYKKIFFFFEYKIEWALYKGCGYLKIKISDD